MFILSIIFFEFLALALILIELFYCYKKADYRFSKIRIGFIPAVYKKRINKTDIVLGLTPFNCTRELNTDSPEKLEKINIGRFMFKIFLIILAIQFMFFWFEHGLDTCYSFYKAVFTFRFNDFNSLIFSNPEVSNSFNNFIIITLSSFIIFLWYLIILRNLLSSFFSIILLLLKVPRHDVFAIIITFLTLIFFIFKKDIINILLIFNYKPFTNFFFDFLIATVIFTITIAIIIEILSKTKRFKQEN